MYVNERLQRLQMQLRFMWTVARFDADLESCPQTIWKVNDNNMPFRSLAKGFRPKRKYQPIVTVLPERYFTTTSHEHGD